MTRADLPPGTQAVQAAHAAIGFAVTHPHLLAGTVALLCARNELELCWLLESARRDRVTALPFYEPDLGGALTAIALEPAGRRLCSKYPLAMEGSS